MTANPFAALLAGVSRYYANGQDDSEGYLLDEADVLAALAAALAAERAKVAKLVEYHAASEAILSIESEWRSRKADGLLDGSNIFNLTDKLTAAEARLAKARAAITEASQ